MLKVALVGYGLAGKVFHEPLINACEGLELVKVLRSKDSLEDVLKDSRIDLIVNAAPNSHHYEYTKKALLAGKHVVVEKPFVNSVIEGKELIELANSKNLILSVFHNRRWDGDFLTIKDLIEKKQLGEIKIFESHFDRYRPEINPENWREKAAPGAGIVYDLGAHLIDQALTLFGEPESIYADIEAQRGSEVDDYFLLIFTYGKMRVRLEASCMRDTMPRFSVHGTKGQFVSEGMDPQEAQLKEGISPHDPAYGKSGDLMPGSYIKFYENIAAAIQGNSKLEVTPDQALRIIEIIEEIKLLS